MSVEIIPVESSRELRRFVDIPWKIYNAVEHPQWVPPLRIAVRDAIDRTNPFYRDADRQLFLAIRDGRAVGRIAAIDNRAHNAFHHDRVGFFGFFECADDQQAADALFASAETWLRGRGRDTMRGPMNPSTNHECGMLVCGYDEPATIMTTWNPAYYPALVEAAGFRKARDLLAYLFSSDGDPGLHLPERYERLAHRALAGRTLTFRNLRRDDFEREVRRCLDIYNAAWADNWGFVPMSYETFLHEAKVIKYIGHEELAFFAEIDGEPAGFVIVLPDYNPVFKAIRSGRLLPTGVVRILAAKSRLRTYRIMILGTKPEFRNRGLYPLFASEISRRTLARDAMSVEASWVLEDNDRLNRPLAALGARQHRRWRIYDRAIA